MCVLDSFQNNGIGNKILNEAEKECKNSKIINIWMNSRIKAAPF